MKWNYYKALLILLQGLVYFKRGLVRFFVALLIGVKKIGAFYQRTVGFHVYKSFFGFWKRIGKHIPLAAYTPTSLLGQRGVLQIAILVVLIFFMLPHSRLIAQSYSDIPGRDTLFYDLVGPGAESEEFEQVVLDAATAGPSPDLWRAGVVAARPEGSLGTAGPEEIAGISSGGTALTKPVILPGVDVGTIGRLDTRARTAIVLHEVQAGEVIGSIATRYGISIDTILWANNLSFRSYIRPGDKLKILPVDGVAHTVKKGDTLGKIASAYKAKPDDVVGFNKLQADGSDLVVGEELIVPGGVKPQPRVAPPTRLAQPFSRIAAPPPSITAPAGSGYIWPTTVSRITQYFGWRHTGLDIAGPVGTPIYASRAGVVLRAQCGWNGGYGCYITIDHGGGVQTLYGHNSQLFVKPGDVITQGQGIAAMGSTGRSTGPHVHFEVHVNGRRQNPLKYVRR